jgi:sigma-B regulation protein RsbU (phosphoserine phosphatase)
VDTRSSGKRQKIISLRFIASAAAVFLIVATVVSMGVLNERNTRNTLTEEIESRMLLEVRNLANLSIDALLLKYPELVLQPVVKEILAERPELAFVVVLDHEGKIQGHVDPRMLRTPFEFPAGLEQATVSQRLRPGEKFLGNSELLVAAAPASHEQGQHVGTAIIGLERSYLKAKVAAARKAQSIIVGLLLVVGTIVALLLMSQLMNPIKVLKAGLERIGRGDLDTPLQLATRTELGQLAETVNDMASQLKVAQAELVDKERLSYEMELARNIQRSLLPKQSQRVGEFSILGFQNSAAEVGGDYYDVFQLPNGKVGLVIADVAGKGLAGCLATFMLAALLRAYRASYESPSLLLTAVEEQLLGALPRGTFVTMFYGILEPASGRLVFASAGHGPALVYRAIDRKVEWLKPPGRPLASSRKKSLRATRVDALIGLEPGDVLLQFTDGINEAWDRTRSKQFDFGNVERVAAEVGDRGADAVLSELRRAVDDWVGDQPRRDDETVLVVGREKAASESPGVRSPASREFERGPLKVLKSDSGEAVPSLEREWKRKEHLLIPNEMAALHRIAPWVRSCQYLNLLSREDANIVTVALYEVCANIIEHGISTGDKKGINLYWHPDENGDSKDSDGTSDLSRDPDALAQRIRRGYFIICDHTVPFDHGQWKATEAKPPKERRASRGYGIEMIYRAMSVVHYQPSTSAGNITMMRYDPRKHRAPQEVSHV